MCGGVGFQIKNIPEKELIKYYSTELVEDYKKQGKARSFFWHENAVLPIKNKDGVQLKLWGNKDNKLKLPKTGWARQESMNDGKWDYLNPELVDIPIEFGYEKKTWFNTPKGTKGILVNKNNEERVYIITKEASEEYKQETGHDREPLGVKEKFRNE